jgi:hypothetical protein
LLGDHLAHQSIADTIFIAIGSHAAAAIADRSSDVIHLLFITFVSHSTAPMSLVIFFSNTHANSDKVPLALSGISRPHSLELDI